MQRQTMQKIDTHCTGSLREAAWYWSILEYRPDTTETAPNSPMARRIAQNHPVH